MVAQRASVRDPSGKHLRLVRDDPATTWPDETLRERERRFRELLEALPAAVYTTDTAGRITFYNQAAVDLWGHRPEPGSSEWCGSWKLYWPDGTPLPHNQCPMAVALKEDRPIRGMEAIAERPDGTRVPFIPFPTPLHDASGALVGAVNMLVDITERKQEEERQALLIRELHHRVKNTLATVQAIMSSTARSSASIEEFQQAFIGRVSSLSRTHTLLADDQWQTVLFRDLLRIELDPYDDDTGKRVRLDGPPIELPGDLAVPLGMAVHELTTNAVKYGALSELGGSVEVCWSVTTGASERRLDWTWVERDGPVVEPPQREGFGSRLLERVLTRQVHAQVEIDYAPQGLRVSVQVPLPSPANQPTAPFTRGASATATG
jgi:PAS domain S-box-containing protein